MNQRAPLFLLLLSFFVFSCGTENEPTYTLTTTVSPSEGGTISPTDGEFTEGEQITLTGTPSNGWVFSRWEGDWSGTSNPVKITIDKNYTIIGVFERRDYPLNINIEGEGTVTETIVSQPNSEYTYETIVELAPKPSEGWEFVEWGGDLSGFESPQQIIIDGEKNVYVTFIKLSFYLGENGVTVMCPETNVGDKETINGIEYESVDRELLIQRRDEGRDLTKVCVSNVTDMSSMFTNSPFNQPIGNWDVSNVTSMNNMFSFSQFNQPIGDWDVSNVIDMFSLFGGSPFNQPLENWDVSNVTDMKWVFSSSPFNQPIGNWDVSNVTNMFGLFAGSPFNQPLENWDVSKVTDMGGMFYDSPFNQPIENWDVSNVTDMSGMFGGTVNNRNTFNQPIGDWDVSKVTDMGSMFAGSEFNQPIETWDMSKVTDMDGMFAGSEFNQPIGDWDVSNVTNTGGMFFNSQFNQPIGDWDVSNVTYMVSMFKNSQFNQPINSWCVNQIPTEPFSFSTDSPLTDENKPIWGTCPD